MDRTKVIMLAINVVGGLAVLGSYAHGLTTHPNTAGQVWGGVPEWMKPYYTVSMLTAAAGYFLFSYFVFFRLDERTRIAGRFGYGAFNLLYLLILLPSALWMPLTFAMLESPGAGLWVAIRIVLAIVGVGSLGLIGALLSLDSGRGGAAYGLAIVGSVAFAVQTALLDAIVWPAFFPSMQ